MNNGHFIPIRCPWESGHSTQSDKTATVWFLAGSGGYERGHFRCLHVSCSHRTTEDLLDAIGYTVDGLERIDDTDEIEIQRAFDLQRRTELIARGASPVDGPRLTRDKTGILWTINNVVEALRFADFGGLLISYDHFIDHIVVSERTATGEAGSLRLLDDNDYTRFAMRCGTRGFKTSGYPTQMIRDAFRAVAMERAVDSAIDWINGLPEWDQVPRIDTFCARYLGAEETPYSRSVSRYWWSAHAGRILSPGCQADMAIVLISEQGTGKTSAVRAISPHPEWFCELSLADRDADLSRAMRGKVVGEIAELRGLSGRESDAIKAWVSRRTESWVPKYREQPHTFLRRLVVIGTANNEEFLSDETGHRRWLPLKVGNKIKVDQIVRDRAQLWAEAAGIWRGEGVTWKDAQTLAASEHATFEVRDAWEEAVVKWLDEEGLGGERPRDWEFLTTAQVLEGALRLDPNKQQLRDQHRIGRIMRQVGYQKWQMRTGDRVFKIWKKAGGL